MALPEKKDSAAMTKALAANLSIPIKKELNLLKDSEEDYEIARKSIKDLMDKSSKAIEEMLNLATATEHPRAFEVLAGMLKTSAEITRELTDLQKSRKNLAGEAVPAAQPGGNGATQNNFFVGSTTELQKLLKAKLNPPIDVTDVPTQ